MQLALARRIPAWLAACVLLAGSAGIAEPADDDALIGHWPLDEGQGYILKDAAGRVGDGEQIGAEWVPLGSGWCLKLGTPFKADIDLDRPRSPLFAKRGADRDGFAYARLPLRNACRLAAQGGLRHKTLSLWLKPLDGGAADPRQSDRVNAFYGGGFMLTISRSDTSRPNWVGHVFGQGNHLSIQGPVVDETAWTHLLLTHDDVFARFYVNGREIGAENGPYLMARAAFPVSEKKGAYGMYVSTSLIGRDQMYPYKGLVDDIRLYARSLTDAEVRALHQSGLESRSAP